MSTSTATSTSSSSQPSTGPSPAASSARLSVAASDLAAWAGVSGLAAAAKTPLLSTVHLEYAAAELRAVATDAHMLAVARLFDPAATPPTSPAKKKAAGSPSPHLRAVPNPAPLRRPAGHVGLTGFRPSIELTVELSRFTQLLTFLKEVPPASLVDVTLDARSFGVSYRDAALSMSTTGQSFANYQKLFSDVTSASRKGDPAPLNLNAEQLTALVRSTGARTAAQRRRLLLHAEGFTKPGSDHPVPLRIDVLNEEEMFGPHRRWVGLLAPIRV